jgi:hypothetical protein
MDIPDASSTNGTQDEDAALQRIADLVSSMPYPTYVTATSTLKIHGRTSRILREWQKCEPSRRRCLWIRGKMSPPTGQKFASAPSSQRLVLLYHRCERVNADNRQADVLRNLAFSLLRQVLELVQRGDVPISTSTKASIIVDCRLDESESAGPAALSLVSDLLKDAPIPLTFVIDKFQTLEMGSSQVGDGHRRALRSLLRLIGVGNEDGGARTGSHCLIASDGFTKLLSDCVGRHHTLDVHDLQHDEE